MSSKRVLGGLAVVIALGAGACSSDSKDSTDATSNPTSAAASEAAAATDQGNFTKVSANDASVGELTAAFEANGIANASRWAREVEEYRPYDETDPTMASLRKELAKYNPAAGVVDDIVASLSLP